MSTVLSLRSVSHDVVGDAIEHVRIHPRAIGHRGCGEVHGTDSCIQAPEGGWPFRHQRLETISHVVLIDESAA